MKAQATSSSQPERLKDAMRTAGMQHGDTVRANIRRVVADQPLRFGRVEMRFCPMEPQLEILEVVSIGDSLPLPNRVKVKGVELPKFGYYDLENVIVTSNGRMQVIADDRSRTEPSPPAPARRRLSPQVPTSNKRPPRALVSFSKMSSPTKKRIWRMRFFQICFRPLKPNLVHDFCLNVLHTLFLPCTRHARILNREIGIDNHDSQNLSLLGIAYALRRHRPCGQTRLDWHAELVIFKSEECQHCRLHYRTDGTE